MSDKVFAYVHSLYLVAIDEITENYKNNVSPPVVAGLVHLLGASRALDVLDDARCAVDKERRNRLRGWVL